RLRNDGAVRTFRVTTATWRRSGAGHASGIAENIRYAGASRCRRRRIPDEHDGTQCAELTHRSAFPIMNALFPDWLRGYEARWLRPDLVAGLTLFAYLLPAGIGDASLAGLPA